MLFELSDQVRKNILALVGEVDIKGKGWRVIAEIDQALNNPVATDGQDTKAPGREVENAKPPKSPVSSKPKAAPPPAKARAGKKGKQT